MAEEQLSDECANVHKDTLFNEKILQALGGTSNQFIQNLNCKGKISDKQLNNCTYEYKEVSKLGKLYVLLKIRKKLHNILERPVISN